MVHLTKLKTIDKIKNKLMDNNNFLILKNKSINGSNFDNKILFSI